MGDWWNPEDDLRRLQQGVRSIADAGGVVVQIGEFLLREGVAGLDEIIPDLVRIFEELGEDPLDTLPRLLDHIRRVGFDIAYVLREFVAGINAYGVEGYGRHLIARVVVNPYEQALRQASIKSSSVGAHLLETVAGVQQRLAPLYNTSGASLASHTHPSTGAGSSAFQGMLAESTIAQFSEAQARLGAIATALDGGSGYTFQDALNDANRDMQNTVGIRIAAIVIVDLILLAGCVVVDAATGGIMLVATPVEIGTIAVIDLIIWFMPYIMRLLQWLILAATATREASPTTTSPTQTKTKAPSSGGDPDPLRRIKLAAAIAAAVGVAATILIKALSAHQRDLLKQQLAAQFPHCADHLDDLLDKYPDLSLEQLVRMLQLAQLRAQLVAMQDMLTAEATTQLLQQALGNWLKRIKEQIRAIERAMQDPKSLTESRFGGYVSNFFGIWGEIALCKKYVDAGQLVSGPRKIGDVKVDFAYNDGNGDTYAEVKNLNHPWDVTDPNWADDLAQAKKFAEAAKNSGATNIEWDCTNSISDAAKQALRDAARDAGFDDAHIRFNENAPIDPPPDPKEHPWSNDPGADWCDPNAWPPYTPTP